MPHVLCYSHTCLVFFQELARPRRAPNHEELKQVILQKYVPSSTESLILLPVKEEVAFWGRSE